MPTETSKPALETITDNLAQGYKRLVHGTMLEASQIQNQRRVDDSSLQDRWFYPANLPLYRLQDGELVYGLSGAATFNHIAGADIDEFTKQIRENGVYALTEDQIKYGENAKDIVWAEANQLKLKEDENTHDWSYFIINTQNPALNPPQQLFATKVHGSMKEKYNPQQKNSDFHENMSMLSKRISETKIWLPTPEHIMQYLKKAPKGAIVARASWLNSFSNNSYFNANSRNVDSRNALRGVPCVAEGDAPKY